MIQYNLHNLEAVITLKRWNNATNTYDIVTKHIKSKAITVINQRFISIVHMKN